MILLQKAQGMYLKKRQYPTLTSHMAFLDHNTKLDKVFSGFINLFFMIFLVSQAGFNIVEWLNDKKPYMASHTIPYTIKGEFKRNERVYLNQLNPFFFKIENYKGQNF